MSPWKLILSIATGVLLRDYILGTISAIRVRRITRKVTIAFQESLTKHMQHLSPDVVTDGERDLRKEVSDATAKDN